MKETNLEKVREASILLLNAVKIDTSHLVLCHPFFSSVVVPAADKTFLFLSIPAERDRAVAELTERLNRADAKEIFALYLGSAWYLTWLHFTHPYLSDEDFSSFLGDAWTQAENPNQDANVPLRTAVSWFRAAKPEALMSQDERDYLAALPEMVTLYRGVGVGREKYGLSFTANPETADWFRHRWDKYKDGETLIISGTVPKELCLAYFNRRGEDEIVLDVFRAKKYLKEERL